MIRRRYMECRGSAQGLCAHGCAPWHLVGPSGLRPSLLAAPFPCLMGQLVGMPRGGSCREYEINLTCLWGYVLQLQLVLVAQRIFKGNGECMTNLLAD